MNFPVLKSTIAYARRRAAEVGKDVDFSLTTNATLLRPDVIEFLADENVGVTISIDGPEDLQNKFRVFHNAAGSYAVVAPKIKALLERHRTRPIGARVTLTRQTLDVGRIYRHLADEMGFWEVGFAPVTTAPGPRLRDRRQRLRSAARPVPRARRRLSRRRAGQQASRFLQRARDAAGDSSGPCQGLSVRRGHRADGRCDRRSGGALPSLCRIGRARTRHRQRRRLLGEAAGFLESHHINNKTDCQTCWARPICAGGCYHEAHTRYESTSHPNLHYCEWIRGWTHTCLEIYGALAERNPGVSAAVRRRAR